jgi:exopolysaccharide biosynthesis polyprenyl glycosylphosphotransferase
MRLSKTTHYILVHLPIELFALFIAWHLTLLVRPMLNPFMAQQLTPSDLARIAPPLKAVMALWVAASLWLRRHQSDGGGYTRHEFSYTVESVLLAGLTAIVATFFYRGYGVNLSRSFVPLFVPISLVTLIAARFGVQIMSKIVQTRWPVRERLAVIGHGAEVLDVISRMQAANRSIEFRGLIVGDSGPSPAFVDRVRVLGKTSQLAEVINLEQLDRVLVTDGHLAQTSIDACKDICKRMGVTLTRSIGSVSADERITVTRLLDLELLELNAVMFSRREQAIKRVLDVVLASAALSVLLPLLIAICILIKLTSRGPVLYTSRRVGRGGRHFTFLKFRSMYAGAHSHQELLKLNEKNGHLFKIKHDPRVTPLGHILRRYSLDELPQFVNVLLGDMSIVGPRPLPTEDLESDGQSHVFERWARDRSGVPPGITGLWQVRGRSELSFEDMVDLDIYYVLHWSLSLDLHILLETPRAVVAGRGAY